MRLGTDLVVVLQREQDRWRLALGKEGARPSQVEIEACREAFGVDSGTEPAFCERIRINARSRRQVQWQVAELSWQEA